MMAAASGCSLPRSRPAASRRISSAVKPLAGSTAARRGLPSVSVPVLSTTSVWAHPKPLALGVLIEDALATAADADHHRHRRGQPESAWADNDRYGHGVTQSIGRFRSVPILRQRKSEGFEDDRRDGVAAQPESAGPARSRHDFAGPRRPCAAISARNVSEPTFAVGGPARAIDRGGDDLAAGLLLAGIGSPEIIDSSAVLRPSMTTPSAGTFSPGRTHDRSPTRTCRAARLLRPVGLDAPSCLRDQAEQSLDRPAGLAAGLQLQNLPEENQDGHHDGRVKVRRHRATAGSKSFRKKLRGDRRNQAVKISRADAEGDQCEHVGTAVDDGRPARSKNGQPHQKRPRRPERVAPSSSPSCSAGGGAASQRMSPMARRKIGRPRARPTQKRRSCPPVRVPTFLGVTLHGSRAIPRMGSSRPVAHDLRAWGRSLHFVAAAASPTAPGSCPRLRVLAGCMRKTRNAAHLRNLFLLKERPRPIPESGGRSQEGAITACWASNSIVSIQELAGPGLIFGIPRAESSAKRWKTGCAPNT